MKNQGTQRAQVREGGQQSRAGEENVADTGKGETGGKDRLGSAAVEAKGEAGVIEREEAGRESGIKHKDRGPE